MLQNARVKAFIFFELREGQQGGVKITPLPPPPRPPHTHTHTLRLRLKTRIQIYCPSDNHQKSHFENSVHECIDMEM